MKNKLNNRMRYTLYLVLALVPFIFFYLAWSFVLLDFNAKNWEESSRAFYIVLSTLFSLLVVVINLLIEDGNEKL